MKIAAVVVTYNRKALLEKCIEALENQSTKIEKIFIINNASTDRTSEFLKEKYQQRSNIECITLLQNTGGAGGFCHGLSSAFEANYDWAWIMDDDACPAQNAAEELLKVISNDYNLYGSIAINDSYTSWPTTIEDGKDNIPIEKWSDLPDSAKVVFLPFLGLAISKKMVEKIGLPDKDYFIAADDLEYCLRAKEIGAQVIVAGQSRIHHPKAITYKFVLLGINVNCLQLQPWKRYYDTRNRLFIARKYNLGLWTKTVPGTLLRTLGAILYEEKKLLQLYAAFAGLIDGLCGFSGKRHSLWKIPQ